MDRDQLAEGGGFFMSMLGAMVLGISIGLGLASAAVKSRFGCTSAVPIELASNTTQACNDVLTATGDMSLAAFGGGGVAFLCGLFVLGYARRGESGD